MTYHNYNKDNKSSTESTMVYYGIENVVNIVLQFLTQSTNIVYACIDQTRPSLITDIAMLKEAFAAAKRRGVRLRYVTEITKDNLFHCKQLLTMVDELRHLDGIKGNFYLNDRAYLAPATYHEKGRPASQIIYSNTKEIVEHQMYVFDTLWTGATPAEHRIEQLEGGVVKHESLQVIADHNKASRIFNQLLRSVKREALLFLPDNKAIDK